MWNSFFAATCCMTRLLGRERMGELYAGLILNRFVNFLRSVAIDGGILCEGFIVAIFR